MIRAQELRIGNLVDRNGIMIIKAISETHGVAFYDTVNKVNTKMFPLDEWTKGIILSEKWLLKAGFIKFSSTQYDRDDFWCLQYIEKKDHAYYNKFWCNQLEIYIQYVHQLQNLYFCLTGEELNINL